MSKRIIAFILLYIFIFTCFNVSASSLKGTDNHWAGEYAKQLFDMGIMTGDENGNANLANNIKRSEFISLLVKTLYADEDIPTGKSHFDDVKKGKWYFDVVSFAYDKGITKGDGEGHFFPESEIKREEIVLMLVRALNLSGGKAEFLDISENYPYYTELSAAVGSKIINGFDDGFFWPKNSATRGEAAAMFVRTLPLLEEKEEPEEVPEPDKENELEIVPPPSKEDKNELEIVPPPNKEDEEIDGPINLTWHHFSKDGVRTSGEYKEGLNVISPTWFRIEDNTGKTPFTYEYKLDGDNPYWFQDIGSHTYVREAKEYGYKIWALFKTNDFSANNTSRFLHDEKARAHSIKYLEKMITDYGIDGINLDFENMLVSDKDLFTQYVSEISEMTKRVGVTLSICVTKYYPAGGTWSMCYDRTALAKYVDYVMLMAYDEYGTWSKVAGSVGSMPWVEESINITLDEVPSEKLVLGIPFYTRLWKTQNGVVVSTAAIGMNTAMNRIKEAEAEIVYDKKNGQNYAEWEKDGYVYKIWLEDETSIKNRIDLMKKYNLAGIASWSMYFEKDEIWEYIDGLLDE